MKAADIKRLDRLAVSIQAYEYQYVMALILARENGMDCALQFLYGLQKKGLTAQLADGQLRLTDGIRTL